MDRCSMTMGARWKGRGLAAGLFLTASTALLAAPACGPGFDATQGLVRTGTVTLDVQRVLRIESAVAVEIRSNPRGDDVTWQFEGTVSATSAGAAERIAEQVDVETTDDRDRLTLTLGQIQQNGRLEGNWQIEAPEDLSVEVVSGGPTTLVFGFEGDVAIEAALSVAVVDTEGNVAIRSGSGEVLVQPDLRTGQTIDIEAGASIQLAAPPNLSASIQAAAGTDRTINITHPSLPLWPGGGLPYNVSVGGALNQIRLVSVAGDVFITLPL